MHKKIAKQSFPHGISEGSTNKQQYMLAILHYNGYIYLQCLNMFIRSTRRTGSSCRVLRCSVLRTAGTAEQHVGGKRDQVKDIMGGDHPLQVRTCVHCPEESVTSQYPSMDSWHN